MSPATQVKVLRALQSGEFRRIGSNRHIKADIRVIAATNKDLREEVQRARFREDLYYRIAVIEIHMPALRERTDDIPFLVEHFLRVNAYGGRERLQVTPEAMACLTKYSLAGKHPGAAERHRAALGARRQPGPDGRRPSPGDREVGSGALRAGRAPPGRRAALRGDGVVRPHARRGGAPPHPADAGAAPLEQEARRGYPRHRHEDALQQAASLRRPHRHARRGRCGRSPAPSPSVRRRP